MIVLLTNDDGYDAPGLVELASAAHKIGVSAIAVAPTTHRSGASRARRSGLRMPWRSTETVGVPGFHVDGSPAACVVFALSSGAIERPTLVISGVNAGENLGAGLTVSGTFGAALEASSSGVPAIAISRQYDGPINSDPETWSWSWLRPVVVDLLNWCLETPGWQLANVNIPNDPISFEPVQTVVSRQSYFADRYDLDKQAIVSDYGYDVERLETDSDIFQFAVKRRITVSFIDPFPQTFRLGGANG